MSATTMKALNYLGPYKVRVEDVERPKLEHPDDIIVKVTTVSETIVCVAGLAQKRADNH